MVVVYSVTRNFYKYLKTAIYSLMRFNSPKLYILAEDDELPFDATVINVSHLKSNGINENTPFSYMSLLRPLLADIIPEDKVIYLDVDTVVCKCMKLCRISSANRSQKKHLGRKMPSKRPRCPE